MKRYSFILVTLLSLSIGLGITKNYSTNSQTNSISNLYVLGDSLSDTGSFQGAANQMAGNSWIRLFTGWKFNKVTMQAPFYQNSFSNGKVFTKVIADKLNLPLIPGWDFKVKNFLPFYQKGNNYAVGGAQAITRNDMLGDFLNYFTIQNQVQALLKQHEKILSNDKFIFSVGANDIMYILEKNQNEEKKLEELDKSIKNQASALINLIEHGAKNIIVVNAPALDLIPAYNKTQNNKNKIAKFVKLYDSKWWEKMNNLNIQHHNVLKIFDLNTEMKLSLEWFQKRNKAANITNAATKTDYDFTKQNGILQPKYNKGVNEKKINNYFFFDDFHPTTTIHQYFGEIIYNRFFKIIKN